MRIRVEWPELEIRSARECRLGGAKKTKTNQTDLKSNPSVSFSAESYLGSTSHQVRVVEELATHIVIDDFLAPEMFEQMWNYFQVEAYSRVDSQIYDGKWLLEDGAAMRGPTVGYGEKWHAEYPTGTAIDFVCQAILQNANLLKRVVGDHPKDWDRFTAFATLYPRNTGLLWHRDAVVNQGSYTFYGHPEWNIEWGGELFLCDLNPESIPADWGTFMKKPELLMGSEDKKVAWSSHLDNSAANEKIMAHGLGRFVLPKPNRLAVIKGGVPHAVGKVREAAGNKVRASVSGFFKKAKSLSVGAVVLWLCMGLSACATSGKNDSKSDRDQTSEVNIRENYSLKKDRENLESLGQQIPNDIKTRNDEWALILEMMADGKEDPSRIRSRFSEKARRVRRHFEDDFRSRRESYYKTERRKREEFTLKQRREQEEVRKKKISREEGHDFYNKQTHERDAFYNDLRSLQNEFEADQREKRREFEAYILEKQHQFEQELRDYTIRYRGQKSKEERPTTGGMTGAMESNGTGLNYSPKANGSSSTEDDVLLQRFQDMPKGPGVPLDE